MKIGRGITEVQISKKDEYLPMPGTLSLITPMLGQNKEATCSKTSLHVKVLP